MLFDYLDHVRNVDTHHHDLRPMRIFPRLEIKIECRSDTKGNKHLLLFEVFGQHHTDLSLQEMPLFF